MMRVYVLIGPGPMQTEMGVIEVVVVVKEEEGNCYNFTYSEP